MFERPRSELEFEQEPRPRARKVGEIEIAWRGADLVAGDLRFPGRAHQHMMRDVPVKSGAEINRIAGESIEASALIMLQIPEVGAADDTGDDLVGECRRDAPG